MSATVYRYEGDNGTSLSALYTFLTEDIATDTKRTTGTFLENATFQISGDGSYSNPSVLRIGRAIPDSENMEYFYISFAYPIPSSTTINAVYLSTASDGTTPTETSITGKRILHYYRTSGGNNRLGLNRAALFKHGLIFTTSQDSSDGQACYRPNIILTEDNAGRFLICFPYDDFGTIPQASVIDDTNVRYFCYYTLSSYTNLLNITPWRNDNFTTLLPIMMRCPDNSFITSNYIFPACTCEFETFLDIHRPPLVALNEEEYVTNGFIYVKAT